MNDISNPDTQLLTRIEPILGVCLLAIAFIIYLNRHRIRHSWLHFRTRYCLDSLGLEQLTNVQCPDGLGHYFNIERTLLRHDGITLVVYKKYSGKIFCSEHIDEWIQMVGLKSYPFKNPLFDLNHQVKAISACIEEIPVNGYLFFDQTTQFPMGHPEQVMSPENIPAELQRKNRHAVEPKVMRAWKTLQQKVVTQ